MNRSIEISNVDKVIFERLSFEAEKQGIDLKTLVMKLIKRSLGLEKINEKNNGYHDLDHLSGTWTEQDAKDFAVNTLGFESIDQELWK